MVNDNAFSIKWLVLSFLLSCASGIHVFLNMFVAPKKINNKYLFFESEYRNILSPLWAEVKGTVIFTPRIYKPFSFIRRSGDSDLRSNNILKYPFFRVCFNENSVKKAYFDYFYKNMLLFLEKNKKIKKIILYSERDVQGSAIVKAARSADIISIGIQNGFIGRDHPDYFPNEKKVSFENIFPDYFISYGDYERRLLLSGGWPSKIIRSSGSYRHDFLKKSIKSRGREMREKYDIPIDKKIIFWPTQSHDPLMKKNGELFLNAVAVIGSVAQRPDWFLLIKLHHDENQKKSVKFYRDISEKNGLNNIKIVKFNEIDIPSCLSISDVVIVKHSTVGMEALAKGIPLINLELKKSWDISQYSSLQSSLIVKKNSDILRFLDRLSNRSFKKLFEREQKRYVRDHFSNFGSATRKIVDFIRK